MKVFPAVLVLHSFVLALLLAALTCPASNLLAADSGWYLNPAVFYHTRESEWQPDWTGSGGKEAWTRLSVSAGFSMAGGLLLGLKYFSEEKTDSPQGSGDPVTQKVTATGLSAGFRMEQLLLLLSIMGIQPPVYTHSESQITLSEGTGTILDIAWFADLGSWFLGPQITWRSFEYKKFKDRENPDSSASQAFTKATETLIEPYLSILILF